jgi:dihydropteroate synthase
MTQTGSAFARGIPAAERCLVMGVVNVTPDSFSDGGQWFEVDAAVRHGLDLVAEGAAIIDVGGESTRPGAQRVSADEEMRRVIPVIRRLAAEDVHVSVDTMRPEVAEAALDAGARLINDVSGGLADPAMPRLVASAQVPYVVMHWRGHSHDMQSRAVYGDVVADVRTELERRMEALVAEGVDPSLIILDPGLGFGKRPEHNWSLLANLDELRRLGRPLLVGPSRKRFLARLLAEPADTPDPGHDDTLVPRPFAECDDATVATVALAAAAGAWCVRVHSVRPCVDAVRVARAWRRRVRAGTRPAGEIDSVKESAP